LLDVPPPGVGFTTVTCAVPEFEMSAAVTVAANWPPFTKVVFNLTAFQWIAEVETKLEPFTVSVKVGPPAVALEGVREVSPGMGLSIVNVSAAEVPPPGAGFTTVTFAVPALAMSAEAMEAVSCILLTKVVVRAEPFHLSIELEMKLEPFTTSVHAAPPAVALEGVREVSCGAAFLTVKVKAFEPPPPGAGFTTVIGTVAAVPISDAGIEAVTRMLLLYVVVRFEPFHCTVTPDTKRVPFTVKVKAAPPAVLKDGVSDVSTGTGLLMLKVAAPDVPPPGAGFTTVT